jgi:uncharacterized protein YbjT (DUF2867 family)
MLALTGTTGKLGGAVLKALLDERLVSLDELVICTSSDPDGERWNSLKSKGVKVRKSNYDDSDSMVEAFSGCSKLFLVSTPRIEMDFNNAPVGEGREKHHLAAIRAAQKAGVKHIYYTSLAFGSNSSAGVMQAHLRTEAFLQSLKDMNFTIVREGLYSESWPLYFGYYNLNSYKAKEIIVAGDGLISWTSIADLGLATALVVADPSMKYVGRIFYLSSPKSARLNDVAMMVSNATRREVSLKIVSRNAYVKYHTRMGKERESIEWWVSSYAALEENECCIKDRTLEELLSNRSKQPKPVEKTINEMLGM